MHLFRRQRPDRLAGVSLCHRFFSGRYISGGYENSVGMVSPGTGRALGFLVGALVVGTAFPHLLKSLNQSLPWGHVILSISAVSAIGGVLIMMLVPDGPNIIKGTRFNSHAIANIFQSKDLRSASFGYFGHMWELYTLWAFVPVLLSEYAAVTRIPLNVSFWSFWVIAVGSLGCIGGGLLSKLVGSPSVAFFRASIIGGLLSVISDYVSCISKVIFEFSHFLGYCSGR